MNRSSGMIKGMHLYVGAVFLYLFLSILYPGPLSAEIVADHTRAAVIPDSAVNLAKSSLHIAYGHTSHGSQLVTGMSALYSHNPLYSFSEGGAEGSLDLNDYAMGGDVGYYPDWVNNTRDYLGEPVAGTGRGANHPLVNVVIWSWCGQVSGLSEQEMIDNYLAPMTQLEADYPGIKFVYMTGHLDGSGSLGDLNLRNNQIRAHVRGSNRVLFDFADIESYDPSGAEYLSRLANDGCYYDSNNDGYTEESDRNWAVDWMAANPLAELTHIATSHCDECAHSRELNCVLKGRAVWWLWARIAGWNGGDNVRIMDTPYATLGDAYLHAEDGSTLKARAITFAETLDLNRGIHLTFEGGYNDDFSGRSGLTTQDGELAVSAGSLTVDRLVVR